MRSVRGLAAIISGSILAGLIAFAARAQPHTFVTTAPDVQVLAAQSLVSTPDGSPFFTGRDLRLLLLRTVRTQGLLSKPYQIRVFPLDNAARPRDWSRIEDCLMYFSIVFRGPKPTGDELDLFNLDENWLDVSLGRSFSSRRFLLVFERTDAGGAPGFRYEAFRLRLSDRDGYFARALMVEVRPERIDESRLKPRVADARQVTAEIQDAANRQVTVVGCHRLVDVAEADPDRAGGMGLLTACN